MKNRYRVVLGGLVIAVVLAGAWFLRDQILKKIVVSQVSRVLGAPVRIDRFSFGILNQSVRISGLKVYNPEGFPEGLLAEFSSLQGRFDLKTFLSHKKIHLSYAEIELAEMSLVKNKDGKLNVDALKVAQKPDQKSSKDEMPFQIDVLKLGIGKIVRKDYGQGSEPSIQVYDMNIHKNYKNITSATQLATLLFAEPLKTAGVKGAIIYGAAMATGVGIIPVAIIATLGGKDRVLEHLEMPFDKLYQTSLAVLKRMGTITAQNEPGGMIRANVHGAQVTLKLKKEGDMKTQMAISARKYLLPKPEIAAGVLYQIMDQLK